MSTIYTAPPADTFTLQVPGSLNSTVQYQIQSVSIDNYTNQYVYFPLASKWIPPNRVGAVFRYAASSTITAVFASPVGYGVNAAINGQTAVITTFSYYVPESSGSSGSVDFPLGSQQLTAIAYDNINWANGNAAGYPEFAIIAPPSPQEQLGLEAIAISVSNVPSSTLWEISYAGQPVTSFIGWDGVVITPSTTTLMNACKFLITSQFPLYLPPGIGCNIRLNSGLTTGIQGSIYITIIYKVVLSSSVS